MLTEAPDRALPSKDIPMRKTLILQRETGGMLTEVTVMVVAFVGVLGLTAIVIGQTGDRRSAELDTMRKTEIAQPLGH